MKPRKSVWTMVLGLGLALASCDDLGGDKDGGVNGNEGGNNYETSPLPDIGTPPKGRFSTASAGGSIEVDFSSASDTFLVVPYSVSTTAATAIDFDIKVTGSSSGSKSFALTVKRPLPMFFRNPALWLRWEQRLAVEAWLHKRAAIASRLPLVDKPGKMGHLAGCTTSASCGANEVCHAGNCTSTVTLNVAAFANVSTINFSVKKKGTKAAILVDPNDTVTEKVLTDILDALEKNIWNRDVALFGNPTLKSGQSTLSSDRNADGLIWLVLTKHVSDKLPAVGFFDYLDFAATGGTGNKADILYVDTTSTSALTDVYPILAHELQHLLNYATKKYLPEYNGKTGAQEALWLDEGQAHFAEDACGYGGENTTLLDQEVFTAFEETSVFTTKDSKAMRGMAFLFVRYLFEQRGGVTYQSDGSLTDKGGAALLKKLHTTAKQGAAAVTENYGDYKTAFGNWFAAMGLDGRGVTTYPAYIYQALQTDPVTKNQLGVKIRGKRMDNTGVEVNLQGPAEEDIKSATTSDTIPNATGKFFKLTKYTGKVQISVTSLASDFKFAVIKISN